MRVLHIIGTMRGGGAETLVRELLPRLQLRNVSTAAFSAFEPNLTKDERRALSYNVLEGNKRRGLDAMFGIRLVRAIRDYRPDIVHTHTITGKYWGRAAAILAGVRTIVHTEHSPQQRLPRRELLPAAILAPRTSATVTFSQRTLAFIKTREPVYKGVIIPNGIEVPPAPTANDRFEAKRVLGALGNVAVGVVANFQPQKNQRLAIQAMTLLSPDERRSVRLEFFGSGPDEAAVRTLAETSHIAQARFWGFRADVRKLLPGLDLLLTVATVEAAPISLLEAMAAGLPIVGTPHHGTMDLLQHKVTGLICNDWSPQAVATALRFAIAGEAWRASAGAAARLRLEACFDIERVADRHVQLYASLLDGSSAESASADRL